MQKSVRYRITRQFCPLLPVAALVMGVTVGIVKARDAITIHSTALKDSPRLTAAQGVTLPQGTSVKILKREGGWYQIQSGNQTGWLKLLEVRFPAEASQNTGSGLGDLLSLRQGHSNITATTGVRGIGEADIKNAKPNFSALIAVSQYQVSSSEAKAFAKAGQLKSRAVKYPEVRQ